MKSTALVAISGNPNPLGGRLPPILRPSVLEP